jgi:hypothetical protein
MMLTNIESPIGYFLLFKIASDATRKNLFEALQRSLDQCDVEKSLHRISVIESGFCSGMSRENPQSQSSWG